MKDISSIAKKTKDEDSEDVTIFVLKGYDINPMNVLRVISDFKKKQMKSLLNLSNEDYYSLLALVTVGYYNVNKLIQDIQDLTYNKLKKYFDGEEESYRKGFFAIYRMGFFDHILIKACPYDYDSSEPKVIIKFVKEDMSFENFIIKDEDGKTHDFMIEYNEYGDKIPSKYFVNDDYTMSEEEAEKIFIHGIASAQLVDLKEWPELCDDWDY